MAVYRFEVEIGEDHHLKVPDEVPVGRAEIVVMPQETEASKHERFVKLVHELANGPFHTRTKEEIDAYIRHERESWE